MKTRLHFVLDVFITAGLLFALTSCLVKKNSPNRSSVINDGIEYTLETDHGSYALGEEINFIYRVTNQTGEEKEFADVPNCTYCMAQFYITKGSEDIWRSCRVMPPCGWKKIILKAGETQEFTVPWKMENDRGTFETADDEPVQPGRYQIFGELQLSENREGTSLSIPIEILKSRPGFVRPLPKTPPATITPIFNVATATLENEYKFFEFEDSRAACQATSECILMRVGRCENVQAIHHSQIELANVYTARAKKIYPNIQCAPGFPIEEYEPLCLNQKCQAVLRNYRLLLEVPEQPVVGEPFWIGISFRFPVAAKLVNARIILPDNVKIISGQASWSGPIEALEDHVMWVKAQTNIAGEIYLSGLAGIEQDNSSIPPVSWGKVFKVAPGRSLTPQPTNERILATPTLANP